MPRLAQAQQEGMKPRTSITAFGFLCWRKDSKQTGVDVDSLRCVMFCSVLEQTWVKKAFKRREKIPTIEGLVSDPF